MPICVAPTDVSSVADLVGGNPRNSAGFGHASAGMRDRAPIDGAPTEGIRPTVNRSAGIRQRQPSDNEAELVLDFLAALLLTFIQDLTKE